jgi:hypothetical protein
MREDVVRRHPVLAACAGSAVLWTAFFLLLGPRYVTNDDPLIAMLPAGTGFASAPDEHLVFTNVVIGLALKGLHAAAPGLPWYGLYLLATHVVAQTALLYAALRVQPRGTRLALYLTWFAVAAVPFANNLHFTTAAFVAAQAGVLLALSLLERPAARPRAAVPAGLAVVALVVLGGLIRFEAFALVLVLAAPVAAALSWRRDRRALLVPAAALGAGLAVTLAARAFDHAYYARDAGWAAYRAWSGVLRDFVDFERGARYTPETAAAFRAAGLSRNDHRLLWNWFHPDVDVFDTDRLRAALARSPAAAVAARERVRDRLLRIGRNRTARPILLALPLGLLAAGASRRSRWAMLAGVVASVAALLYLALFRKAPPHVFLPTLAWPLAVSLVLEGGRFAGRAGRVVLAVAGALAAAAFAWALVFQRAESVERSVQDDAYLRALEPLRAAPERHYVLWGTFPYGVIRPLAAPGSEPGFRFFALGWPQRTPTAQRALAAAGLPDLVRALGDPRVRLLVPPEAAPWVEQYARQHRGLSLVLVQETSVPGFGVFRGRVAPSGVAGDRVLRSEPAGPE